MYEGAAAACSTAVNAKMDRSLDYSKFGLFDEIYVSKEKIVNNVVHKHTSTPSYL